MIEVWRLLIGLAPEIVKLIADAIRAARANDGDLAARRMREATERIALRKAAEARIKNAKKKG